MSLNYRFALTVSGGLSMGAYEAGALTQIYQDFYSINEKSEDLGIKIIIDVISGASAGSITGLVLAQAIALNTPPDKFTETMRNTWIVGIDAVPLLKPTNDPENGVFTQNRIDSVAEQAIKTFTSDDSECVKQFNPQNAIAIWMAITNLDGVPYEIKYGGGSSPFSVFASNYHDYAPYFIDGKNIHNVLAKTEDLPTLTNVNPTGFNPVKDISPTTWEEARTNAISGGSFPFAFKTKPLVRDVNLYGTSAYATAPSASNEYTFQVADGGMLGNEPIGKAIDAVSYLEWIDSTRKGDDRSFLIIDPHPVTQKEVNTALTAIANRNVPNGLPLTDVAGKLVNVYFNTSLYSDYNTVVQVNEQLEAIDKLNLAPPLKKLVLEAARLDYKSQKVVLERIPGGPLLPNRLAGTFLNDFGGFFQQDFREHDYQVGQVEARKWFTTWLTHTFPETFVSDDAATKVLTKAPGGPTNTGLANANWNSVAQKTRNTVVTLAFKRVKVLILRLLPVKWFIKLGIGLSAAICFYIFVKGKLVK